LTGGVAIGLSEGLVGGREESEHDAAATIARLAKPAAIVVLTRNLLFIIRAVESTPV
jgi:hypothetical protein